MTNPIVFISYAWENQTHKNWVKEFARRLRRDGVETLLDQWELAPGDQLSAFMERSIRRCDFVLVICTPKYRDKSDGRMGGVGYEGDIMTAEVATGTDRRKFIPLLRRNSWVESAPTWLKGSYYIDLRRDPYSEENYIDLLNTLLDRREKAPVKAGIKTPPSDLWNYTIDEIVNVPNMYDSRVRQAIILSSFYGDPVQHQIDVSGSSFTFVNHLMHILTIYPYLENGKLAISEMLDYIRESLVGIDHAERIQQLIERWNAYYLTKEEG